MNEEKESCENIPCEECKWVYACYDEELDMDYLCCGNPESPYFECAV